MSAMEKSLRKALDAGEADDPAFRESIYAASERALERMLAQKAVSEDVAHLQRTRLAETINRVEDDFYDRQIEAGWAGDGPAQHDPELSLDPAYADAHAYSTHAADDTGHPPADEDVEELRFRPIFDETEGEGRSPAVAIAVSSPDQGDGGDEISEPIVPSARKRGAEAIRATSRSDSRLRRILLIAAAAAMVLGIAAYFLHAGTTGESSAMREPETRPIGRLAMPGGDGPQAGDGEETASAFLRASAGNGLDPRLLRPLTG